MSEILVIFTCKPLDDLKAEGGCGWWKLSAPRARRAGRVLVIHNARDPRKPGDVRLHGKPLFYGAIRDLCQDLDGRWLIRLDRYASAKADFVWPGYRNPFLYLDETEILPGLTLGDWHELPALPFAETQAARKRWDAAHPGRTA